MNKFPPSKLYALAFGAFLGLCIWKFGNPVILDHIIDAPRTPAEFLDFAWPIHWANVILLVLALVGAFLYFLNSGLSFRSRWVWILPLVWLGWQFVSASQSEYANLTRVTLWHFCGCIACFFLGALVIGNNLTGGKNSIERLPDKVSVLSNSPLNYLFVGILIAFVFCQIRAVNQRLFEFPANRQVLLEGEQCGWTNFPPEIFAQMKRENVIISTNGLGIANPVILEKFRKARVPGTLVYPNALAGLILLLFPATMVLVFQRTKAMRPVIRLAAIGLVAFLGLATFFWTGSKLGWLLGMGLMGWFLLRLNWSKTLKVTTIVTVLVLGLGVFVVRFHHYFSAGATSVGARFDYWRAAVRTSIAKPLFGSGPGTFQKAYEQLKNPDSEMARLTHNDFLEQFSDSGLIGGLSYFIWVTLALWHTSRDLRISSDIFSFAVLAGLAAWFIQGIGEFSLYIPALAWLAFTLLGCLSSCKTIGFDKKPPPR